jgi:hypothetical protein
MGNEPSPEQLIGEVTQLTKTTRRARQGFWFPVLLLGFVVLAATPLYVAPTTDAALGVPAGTAIVQRPVSQLSPAKAGLASEEVNGHWYEVPNCVVVQHVVYEPCTSAAPRPSFLLFPGAVNSSSPRAIGIYWLIALPLAYLICGLWYWRRARRRGVATSPVAFIATGLMLLGLLVLLSPGIDSFQSIPVIGDLDGERGLGALLTVALALFVLSYRERSRALASFSALFLGAAILANFYELQNVLYRVGLNPSSRLSPTVGVFFAGLVLTFGGMVFAFRRPRAV